MLNQTLLANRRSTARLLLLLQEENLQKESVLHQHWEASLSRWRISSVDEVIDQFRWVGNQVIDTNKEVENSVIDGNKQMEIHMIDRIKYNHMIG